MHGRCGVHSCRQDPYHSSEQCSQGRALSEENLNPGQCVSQREIVRLICRWGATEQLGAAASWHLPAEFSVAMLTLLAAAEPAEPQLSRTGLPLQT